MPRLAILLLLAACAPVPEIDTSRFAGHLPPAPEGTPRLAPIDPTGVEAAASDLAAGPERADALRGRAAELSAPVIAAPELERLERAAEAGRRTDRDPRPSER